MLLIVTTACSSGSKNAEKTDGDYRQEVVSGMHALLLNDLADLATAARNLQTAAPETEGRGWSVTEDASAITVMKTAWVSARAAYERAEGAIAPLFPDFDAAIDARYDDFLAVLGPSGDADLFDGSGVTGMHAVERILYSDVTPERVVEFEATLPGYVTAHFPSAEAEADAFKNQLCDRFVTDTQALYNAWQLATNYDLPATYGGLIALMNEQREKVDKASTDEEESRYAQHTMHDIRDNLAGTEAAYALFRPWLRSKVSATDAAQDGPAVDDAIQSGLEGLSTLYTSVSGDAIPETPATWSSETPTAADLATPFGILYSSVRDAVDPNIPGSIVSQMNNAARLLGFPQFAEEP